MARASPIIVIADDLSGAAELAGIAFAHGLTAEVQRQFEPSSVAGVIAIDTDTRSLSAAAAAERVRALVEQIHHARPAWLFKKVDSVLRGNPRAEIEAALLATGLPRALLVPANPSRGRVTERGQLFIDGVPLNQTPLANDVEHPRLSADIRAMLGNGDFPVHLTASAAPLPTNGIIVPDVSSHADVTRLAKIADGSTLVAGAADFFTTLLLERSPTPASPPEQRSRPLGIDPPRLLVCGSRTSWNVRRADCLAAGIAISTVHPFAAPPPHFSALLLGIEDSGQHADHTQALHNLAAAAALVINSTSIKTLLAEGGATAAAIANRLGWNRFHVVATAPAGVGVLKPIADHAPLVLIKPGSYPWPAEIWQAFCNSGPGG